MVSLAFCCPFSVHLHCCCSQPSHICEGSDSKLRSQRASHCSHHLALSYILCQVQCERLFTLSMPNLAALVFIMTAVLLSAALLILSLVHYGARHGPSWLDHFKWLALGSAAAGIPRIALKALTGLRHMVSCSALPLMLSNS